jgi:hypothetical protein
LRVSEALKNKTLGTNPIMTHAYTNIKIRRRGQQPVAEETAPFASNKKTGITCNSLNARRFSQDLIVGPPPGAFYGAGIIFGQ